MEEKVENNIKVKEQKKPKKEIVVNFWAFTFLIGSLIVLIFVLAWVFIALM